MNKIKYLIISLVLFFALSFNVKANQYNSVDIDVFVDKEGNATVTEKWDVNADRDTEFYHSFRNIDKSTIEFLSVMDDRGVNYTKKVWNIHDSFEAKANHFGEYRDGNELDLCWGISQMGSRAYTLTYKINNFIYNTSDGYQIIYWTFIPENNAGIGNVLVEIDSDGLFDDGLDVWGYGKSGAPCYVKDNKIIHTSDGYLSSGEAIILLAKFNGGTFDTTNSVDKTFDEMLSLAEEGATSYNPSGNEGYSSDLLDFFAVFIQFIVWGIVLFFCGLGLNNKDEYKGFSKVKDAPPFRDLPLKEDYSTAYFYVRQFGLNKEKNDVLGAILLKLIKDDCIRFDASDKKGKDVITLVKEPVSNLEQDLYKMLSSASVDGVLTSKQFKDYCSKHYTKLFNWVDSVFEDSRDSLVTNKLIDKTEKKRLFFKHFVYTATPSLNEIGMQMGGLKNFFKHFTSLNEKKPIEVKLWREYLIYAQLMGMADKVAKEFKDVYPELAADPNYINNYNTIGRVVYFSDTSVRAATSAHAAAASSYSGGGGGFSSGGGGGGSFGGGGSVGSR